ncbi:MAG: hypothetical protein ISR83_03565 [Candidatus Marinimicrobia bacterium]|nr:hypothetical protein [Candidatus Neomarinimicrobiota bacterium]
MKIVFVIRAMVFLVAGLTLFLWPKKVFQFQQYVINRLPFKYNVEKERKYYPLIGIIFFIISIFLFVVSFSH